MRNILLPLLVFFAACKGPVRHPASLYQSLARQDSMDRMYRTNQISFALALPTETKDSIVIIGSDTIYFTGTPRNVTVYDWAVSSIRKKKDTVIVKPVPSPSTTSYTFSPAVIPASDIDLVAPGRGANMFYDKQILNIPDPSKSITSMDRDVRYSWWQFCKGAGSTYDFSVIDADFKACIAAGQKLSFRVMTLDTDATSYSSTSTAGNKITYPIFLHNQMQAEGVKDWAYSGSWIPNWNSPSYLAAWAAFNKALADHIATTTIGGVAIKNVIYHIDISGFGNYSEFHSYPFINSYPSASLKLTDASYKQIIDAQVSAFPNYPLIANINMFVGEMSLYQGWYSLTASNEWGKFGIRNDHFGWTSTFNNDVTKNTRTYNGVNFKNEILSRYMYAPICGEPMNNAANVTDGGNCAFWNLENEVRTYHASQFSNQNGTGSSGACVTANYINASKACGYHIYIKAATAYADATGRYLSVQLKNDGIAPVYEKWDLYVIAAGTQINTNYDIGKLPAAGGGGFTMNIPAGSYTLYIIAKDPTGYRKPFPLYNAGRLSDGSYKLGDVIL